MEAAAVFKDTARLYVPLYQFILMHESCFFFFTFQIVLMQLHLYLTLLD